MRWSRKSGSFLFFEVACLKSSETVDEIFIFTDDRVGNFVVVELMGRAGVFEVQNKQRGAPQTGDHDLRQACGCELASVTAPLPDEHININNKPQLQPFKPFTSPQTSHIIPDSSHNRQDGVGGDDDSDRQQRKQQEWRLCAHTIRRPS
jgi:hypothetical protein